MLSLKRRSIVCPYCLAEVRTWRKIDKCPKCKGDSKGDSKEGSTGDLPIQYVDD